MSKKNKHSAVTDSMFDVEVIKKVTVYSVFVFFFFHAEDQPQPIRFRCFADQTDGPKCKMVLFALNQRNAVRRKRKTRSISRSLSPSSIEEESSYVADNSVIGKELLKIELAVRRKRRSTDGAFIQNKDKSGPGFTKETAKLKKFQTNESVQTTRAPLPADKRNQDSSGLKIIIPDEVLKIPTTSPTLQTDEISVSDAVQILANKYCRYRDPGLYKIPLICDVFILCSTGGQAKPLVCPEGTSFNPRINVCDHGTYYECHKGEDNDRKYNHCLFNFL